MLRRLIARCLLLSMAPLVVAGARGASVTVAEARPELGGRAIRLTFAVFSSADFQVRVIDNAGEDERPKFATLREAMAAHGCAAGCNGGFFNRQPFAPVGGMTSGGKIINPVDPASWMQGVLLVRAGAPALVAREAAQPNSDVTELLQSGTWLVRDGQPETDNSRKQSARRTFICHDAHGTWALGVAEPCALHELAAALREPAVTRVLDVRFALNLDGGPSTGLWVKGSATEVYVAERWPVRNYVGLVPRAPLQPVKP